MKRFLLLVLSVCALAACSTPQIAGIGATPTPTCESGLPAFAKTLDPLAREWDDANALANSTPRASLAVQIGNLQSVRRRVQDVSAPECGATLKQHLIGTMDATIAGYIAFLGQKPDTEVQGHFTTASSEMKAYQESILAVYAPPTATP